MKLRSGVLGMRVLTFASVILSSPSLCSSTMVSSLGILSPLPGTPSTDGWEQGGGKDTFPREMMPGLYSFKDCALWSHSYATPRPGAEPMESIHKRSTGPAQLPHHIWH